MTLALIDADIIIYKAALGAEKENRWPDGIWTYQADEREGIKILREKVDAILKDLQTEEYFMCLSDHEVNFRKECYPKYKGNRSGTRRPLLLNFLRDYVRTEMKCVEFPEVEADDVMGIVATNEEYIKLYDGKIVICTIDKDLDMIPNTEIYNFDTGVSKTYTDSECMNTFYKQVLTGDSVDGYPGCPGVGIKTATGLLGANVTPPAVDQWSTVLEQFQKKKLTVEDAVKQARCAWILRSENYNIDTGELTLWSAPL